MDIFSELRLIKAELKSYRDKNSNEVLLGKMLSRMESICVSLENRFDAFDVAVERLESLEVNVPSQVIVQKQMVSASDQEIEDDGLITLDDDMGTYIPDIDLSKSTSRMTGKKTISDDISDKVSKLGKVSKGVRK